MRSSIVITTELFNIIGDLNIEETVISSVEPRL